MTSLLSSDDRTALKAIHAELLRVPKNRQQLIPLLQLIQNRLGYLPTEALVLVAEHLCIPAADVYGVATFYNQFRFNPPGRYPIKVCLGTACHVKGSDIILENFERKLEIKDGETTPDRELSIERVACVGCCALAPVTVMKETVYGHMAPSKVEGLVLQARMATEKLKRQQSSDEMENPPDAAR